MGGSEFLLHDEPDALRLEVRGTLDRALAGQILASVATARSMLKGRPIVMDLRKAAMLEPEASAMLAQLPEARFVAHEANLGHVTTVLRRSARLVSESRLPLLRRWWCALLRRLRPRCSCSFCHTERVWSV